MKLGVVKYSKKILEYFTTLGQNIWTKSQAANAYGAWDMHKNSPKVEWKHRTKFPATTRGYYMVKIARLDDASFL